MQVMKNPVSVIGFHGQTLWHDPNLGSTLQIGFAERLAEETGVPVAHQFRRGDMAREGSRGAAGDIVPRGTFQRDTENVAVLNLGGIANLSLLIPGKASEGWTSARRTLCRTSGTRCIRKKLFDYEMELCIIRTG